MPLPNVMSYTKNVAKSIAYSSVDLLKEDMPTLAAFSNQDSNKELVNSIYSAVKDYKGTYNRAKAAITSSKVYEAADLGIKSLFEDFSTGKYYNKERIDAIEDKALEGMMGSFDDMDIDFNDDNIDVTTGDKLIAVTSHVSAMKAADMVSQTQIKSASAIIKAQKAGTRALYLQGTQMLGGLKEVALVGAQTQGAIVNLIQIQKTATENSRLFFENTTKVFQENNAILKEMLDMQRAIYKNNTRELEKQKAASRKRVGFDDVIGSEGEVDMKTYLSSIKRNAKDVLSEKTGGALDVMTGMGDGNMLNMFMSSPLQAVSTMIAKAILPNNARKASRQLDKTLSGLSSAVLARFNKMAKDDSNPASQIIGQIFGIKTSVKSTLDPSKYTKGAVPFDGIVRKTIVDVIPGYLSRIESALTGGPERMFDPDKGRWTTLRAVKTEFDQMRKSSKQSASSDLVSEIRKVMNDKKGSKFADKWDKDLFSDALEKIMNQMYEDDGDFKYKKNDSYNLGIDQDLYNQIAEMITNKNNRGMKQARMRHSSEVMSAKGQLSRRMESLEDNGDSLFFKLFNNTVAADKLKTTKYEEAPKAFGAALELNNQKDSLGHTVFYYLQNMFKELRSIAGNIGGGMGEGGSREFIDSFTIPDNHAKTAKEKYNEKEVSARKRYEEEVARHTEKGGKLYNISDGKGNIRADRATVEQQEILRRIKDDNASHGYVNDLLYGGITKLDKVNKKRKDGEESLIDQKSFFDRIKATKNLTEKIAVLQDQVNSITSKPGNIATDLLMKADDSIYKFFYGDETGEEDENGNKIKGFMNIMVSKLNMTWDKVNTFIDDKLFSPIKKKLGVENMKDLLDKMGVTKVWDGMKDKLFGEIGQDGKREGGIFGDVREEIKNVFGGAKDYVTNALKEVFGPITNKIKEAFANRPKFSKRTYDVNGVETTEGVVVTPRVRGSAGNSDGVVAKAKYGINPVAALADDKNMVISHINSVTSKLDINDPSRLALISVADAVLMATDGETLLSAKDEYAYYIQHTSTDLEVVKFIVNAFIRMARLIGHTKSVESRGDAYYNKIKSKIDKHRANPTKKQTRTENSKSNRSTHPFNDGATDIATKLDELLNFDGNNGATDALKNTILKMIGTDHTGTKGDSITAKELYEQSLSDPKLAAFSSLFKDFMSNKYNNKDIRIKDIIHNPSARPGTLGSIDMMTKVNEILNNILHTIQSVVHTDSIQVVVKNSHSPSPSPLGGNRVRRANRGREQETEGDPTGEPDGELHSSAFGNSFKKNTTSALSKGELYGKDGLFAKVPTTGVYDVKAGTTIYPTQKDKAIELAGEQTAISKFLAQGKTPVTNAEAKSVRSKTDADGKVWTLGDDKKWHRYEITKNGTTDFIMEDGFMDQMYSTARGGLSSVLSGLGLNSFGQSNAVQTMDQAMDMVKKYAPKMTATGLLGGAVGLLSGNPLLGASIGAVTGYVQSSEKAQTMMFGEQEKDADGNVTGRSGGVISKESQAAFKKYMPNLGKYGVAGAALGLLTPFGLVGGALMGSSIGWAKTNDRVKESLFGAADDIKSGLIPKETRDLIKAAAPSMAVGAISTMLLGPLGLVGNLALGSGLGLLSGTEGFKAAVFGEESTDEDGNKVRKGGLVGALKVNVVDPLKDFASTFKTKAEDFVINDLINPLKSGIKPIVHELGLLSKGLMSTIPKMIDRLFESTFGRPLSALFRDYLIAPASKLAGAASGVIGGVGKAIVSAPFKAVGVVGSSLQSKHIRKGDASYISASERLAFRDDHGARGVLSNIPGIGNSVLGSLGFNPTGYRDKYREVDETLAGIQDPEQLKTTLDQMTQLSKGKNYYKKLNRNTGRGIMGKLSAKFHSSVTNRMKKALEREDIDLISNLIRSSPPLKGVEITQAEREALVGEANQAILDIKENNNKQNITSDGRQEIFGKLSEMGFAGINEKNVDKMRKLVQVEYDTKRGTDTVVSEEEKQQDKNALKIADPITENATENANSIIKSITETLDELKELQIRALPESERRKYYRKQAERQAVISRNNLEQPPVDEENPDTPDFGIDEIHPPKTLRSRINSIKNKGMNRIISGLNATEQRRLEAEGPGSDGELHAAGVRYERDMETGKIVKLIRSGDTWVNDGSITDKFKDSVKGKATAIVDKAKAAVDSQRDKRVTNNLTRLNAPEQLRLTAEGLGSDGEAREPGVRYVLEPESHMIVKQIRVGDSWITEEGSETPAGEGYLARSKKKLKKMQSSLKNSIISSYMTKKAEKLNNKEQKRVEAEGPGSDGELHEVGVRYEFDPNANAIRKYVRNGDGWEEAPGKSRDDANRSEEENSRKGILGFAASLGDKLKGLLGLGDRDGEDDGERKPSLISRLVKGLGKVLGIAGIGATAVAGAGHASEFMKTKGIPFITTLWDGKIKPFFTDTVGPWMNTHLGKLGEFITSMPDKIGTALGKFRDFIFSPDGLRKTFSETIFPWFMDGFALFGTNIVYPLTKFLGANIGNIIGVTMKNLILPALKGTWEGLKVFFSGGAKDATWSGPSEDDVNIVDNPVPLVGLAGSSASHLPQTKEGSGWWNKPADTASNEISSLSTSGGSSTLKFSSSIPSTPAPATGNTERIFGATQQQVDNKNTLQKAYESATTITQGKEIAATMAQGADVSDQEIYRTGISGEKMKANYLSDLMAKDSGGNTVLADGTVSTDNIRMNLNPLSGGGSIQDRLLGMVGRKAMGVKGATGVTKLVTGVAGKGLNLMGKAMRRVGTPLGLIGGGPLPAIISGVAGGATSLAGRGVAGAGRALNADSPLTIGRLGKLGAKIQSSTLGSVVSDVGGKLAGSANGVLSNIGNTLSGSGFAQAGVAARDAGVEALGTPRPTNRILQGVGNVIRHPLQTIRSAPGELIAGAKQLPAKILHGLKEAPGALLTKGKNAILAKPRQIIQSVESGIQTVTNIVKSPKKAYDAVMSKGRNIVEGVKDMATSSIDDFAGAVAEKGSITAAKEGAEGAARGASKGVIEKVKAFITKNASGFFNNSQVVNYFKRSLSTYGKELSEEVLQRQAKELAEGIAKSFIEKVCQKLAKATASVIAKVSSTIASAGIAAIAFAVADFLDGAMHAENVFGFAKTTKDSEGIEIGFFERIMAGLIKMANGIFTFGLLPEDMIVSVFMKYIAPLFNVDTKEFLEKQEQTKKIIDEYNAANGTDYKDATSFNQRNSWYNKYIKPAGTKIKNSVTKAGDALFGGNTKADKAANSAMTAAKAASGLSSSISAGGALSRYGLGRIYQNDPTYAGIRFNKSNDSRYQTVGDSGCGPVAAVNAVNYTYGTSNNTIESALKSISKGGYKERNGGTHPDFFDSYFRQNGLNPSKLHNPASIKNTIKAGSPVVMMGKDPYGGYDSPYGPNPHYIVGKGLDTKGNIIVDDPESVYGSASYPASKVLGKTSIAVAASKYGMSSIMNPMPIPNTSAAYPPLPVAGNNKSTSAGAPNNSAGSALNTLRQPPVVPSVTPPSGGYPPLLHPIYSKNMPQIVDPSALTKVTMGDKYKAGFAILGWADKPYEKMVMTDNGASNALNVIVKKTGKIISVADGKKTVKTVVNQYYGIDLATMKNFADAIGPFVDLSLQGLQNQDSALYGRLKTIAGAVNLDIGSRKVFEKYTVGQVCASFNLTFSDQGVVSATTAQQEATAAAQQTDTEQAYADMATQASAEESSSPTNIFSMIGKAVSSYFDYTDQKTGETRNLLNIFGIGGGSIGGDSTTTGGAAGTPATATGVSGSVANGFPYYSQGDPAWGQIPYGNKGTISSSGCGPSSMAMVLKSFGQNLTPKETAAWSASHGHRASVGTDWAFFKNIGNEYDLSTQQSGPDLNFAMSNLKKGYPVISSMKPGDFTASGHFINLVGLDKDGNILVNDCSGSKGAARSAKAWAPTTIINQAKQLWSFNKSGTGSIGKFGSATAGGSTTAAGGDVEQNKKTIWTFLKNKGYTDIAAAGIMGNIQQECGFRHDAVQKGAKNPGLGICQWTHKSRKDPFLAAVPDWKTNLGGQLDFMWGELNSGSFRSVLPAGLNAYTTVESATRKFHDVFEGSADSETGLARRAGYSDAIYTQFASNTGTTYGTGKFFSPIKRVTSRYGRSSLPSIVKGGQVTSTFNDPTRLHHNGVDIAGASGQPIISPVNGVVYRSEYNETNGNMVVVKDDSGYLYTFCHLKSNKVKTGDSVSVGSILGTLGSTGNSFGDHLHYQVTNPQGQFIDPTSVSKTGNNIPMAQTAQSSRAIGGSDGLDYTQLIKIIIELLGTISENTSQFTKVLSMVSEKTGIDMSGVDTSSKTKAYKQIQDKLRALDSGSGKRDLGASMMNSNTDYLVKAMTALAQE